MASVNGRVVALPSPVVAIRAVAGWSRSSSCRARSAPIYDQRIDLRRASRLLIVGDRTVPRVVAQVRRRGPPTRATIEITPAAAGDASQPTRDA